MAANTQHAGWRQGRQLGLIGFVYGASELNGAQFDGASVSHQGCGVVHWSFHNAIDSSLERCSQPPFQPTPFSLQNRGFAYQDAGGADTFQIGMD